MKEELLKFLNEEELTSEELSVVQGMSESEEGKELLAQQFSDVIKNSQVDKFQKLLELASASEDLKDDALVIAVMQKNIDFVKMAIEAGCSEKCKGFVLQNFCAQDSNPEIKELLLEGGRSTEMIDVALSTAAMNQDIHSVAELLQAGGYSELDSNLLIKVVLTKNLQLIKTFLEFGKDDLGDALGGALMAASLNGNTECVSTLLEFGCRDELEASLVAASNQGHTECVRTLLEFGGELLASQKGQAIQAASSKGHAECLKLLIRGEVSSISLNWGVTAANANGHQDCVAILQSKQGTPQHSDAQIVEEIIGGAPDELSSVVELSGAEVNDGQNEGGHTDFHFGS